MQITFLKNIFNVVFVCADDLRSLIISMLRYQYFVFGKILREQYSIYPKAHYQKGSRYRFAQREEKQRCNALGEQDIPAHNNQWSYAIPKNISNIFRR
mgnify:FL=1|jgi:hypothetical protein